MFFPFWSREEVERGDGGNRGNQKGRPKREKEYTATLYSLWRRESGRNYPGRYDLLSKKGQKPWEGNTLFITPPLPEIRKRGWQLVISYLIAKEEERLLGAFYKKMGGGEEMVDENAGPGCERGRERKNGAET